MRTWQAVSLFFFLLLALLLVLAISPAQASNLLQATSTATFVPLYPSSTQVPKLNINCPTAFPVGWGTVTPGLLWSSSCGRCQQTLMAPTETPFITNTPVATVTPGGPTITPTITATSSPTAENPQGITAYITNVYGANLDGSSGGSDTVVQTDIYGFSGEIALLYSGGAWNNYGLYVEITGLETDMTILWEMNGVVYFDYFFSIGEAGFTGLPTYPTNTYIINNSNYRQGQLNWNAQDDGTYTIVLGRFRGQPTQGVTTYHDVDFRILEVNGQSVSLATNEPTPTAVVADYCSVVNGMSAEPFDLGIALPQFAIGQSACYGKAGINLSVSSLNFLPGISLEDIVIPALEICFIEISFGTISLFGVDVNLDSIANLLAAALIIRWFLRS